MNSSKSQSDNHSRAGAASVARQRNTAETAPRSVIRGESKIDKCAESIVSSKDLLNSAFVDWLSFSWEESVSWMPMESEIAALVSKWTGCHVFAQDNGRGGLGFKSSCSLWVSTDGATSSKIGVFYRGGESQKGRVLLQLTGLACSLIEDFQPVVELIDSIGARITRLDLAVDDHDGKFITVRKGVNWYKSGKFTTGGRPPRLTEAGDWQKPEQGLGRTLYVGSRKNGKIARIYEKGKQLGDPNSKWCRFEVEILARDREIPSDALIDPNSYWAGQFPITQSLFKRLGTRIKTVKNEIEASLHKAVKHAVIQIGGLLNFLSSCLQFSDSEIVLLLKKEGVTPARLSPFAHQVIHDKAQFRADVINGFSILKGV